MAFPTTPNTLGAGNAIVSFLTTLTLSDGVTLAYKLAQLEAIKDVTDQVAGGGVCVEVYGDTDISERRGFGGRIYDHQSWFILSLCSEDKPTLAKQIYTVRDALVQPFQQHAQLGNVDLSLFKAKLKDTMKFMRVLRNGQWLRAHLAELETWSEWVVPGGIIS